MVILTFVLVYSAVGVRMGMMAMDEPVEPRLARDGVGATPVRGEITDRHGTLLAANLPAFSLYAHPREIKNPADVAQGLVGIFPEMDVAALTATLSRESGFVWVKRPITPAQRQKVLDLGYPGLQFGVRTMRVYPAGRTVAHIVGGVRAENEDVRYTELAGAGGVEGFFDERLRDPARIGTPLSLSLDLSVQNALRDTLSAGVKQFDAKGAAGVLMDIRTGEVLALVSLPDFDPNGAPAAFQGPAELNPRFNRVAQGRYELGSTFKVFTAAFALEAGAAPNRVGIKAIDERRRVVGGGVIV
jgi:cell division protein FtsI (penicillin-binding protein 3)